jgi:uncharacterized membrane protein (DUF485 family)
MGMEKHSSAAAYIASLGTALFGGVTLQEVALWVGILTAVGTFVVNWYYKEREADQFEALLHKKARKAHLCDADDE